MNKELIRDLAMTGGIYDCLTDPYDKLENGDHHSSVMVDLERFAEKIVRECVNIVDKVYDEQTGMAAKMCRRATPYQEIINELEEHFGVTE